MNTVRRFVMRFLPVHVHIPTTTCNTAVSMSGFEHCSVYAVERWMNCAVNPS